MPAIAKHLEADKNSKVKARLITGLLYRHWTTWQGKTRSHLLSIALEDGKVVGSFAGRQGGSAISLWRPDDYAISPDSPKSASP